MLPSAPDAPLWTWPALAEAIGLEPLDGPDITGISIDTRSLNQGDLFIALSGDPGPRFHSSGSSGRDGHDFLESAVEAGAAGALVSRKAAIDIPTFCVEDTLDGLWALGAAARTRVNSGARIAAVTGSSGKTTARQWLQQLLSTEAKTHASTGSLNNHWGVPLSLARMPADSQFAVFEIGTNNPGEIAPLSQLVRPEVAMVLNVLPAHLGRFDNLDAIRVEKLTIAAGLSRQGTLVLPFELDATGVAAERLLTFGVDEAADVKGSFATAGSHTIIEVQIGRNSWRLRIPTVGEHRARTALGVAAVLHAMGMDLGRLANGFEKLTIPEGRGNIETVGAITIVDDSYNANPVSVRYALEALAEHPGQRIAILGEMLELGDEGARMHQAVADSCVDVDGVITVGNGFSRWRHGLGSRFWGHVASADDIDLNALSTRLEPGAQILVKGGNKVFWVNGFTRRLADHLRPDRSHRV